MVNGEKEYYYAGGKKIKLNRVPDSFAIRYKKDVPSKAIERKLSAKADLIDAEERKEMPKHRIIIVTLPPTRHLADVKNSVKSLEADNDVESITPVYREARSGLRMVAIDEIIVRFKDNVSQSEMEKFNGENDVEVIEQNRFVPNQYLLRVKNPKDTLEIANKYQESGLADFAEPNFVSEAKKAALTNDEFINEQWHLYNTGQVNGLKGEDVKAKEAWDISTGSPNIVIAILDDGVDIDHPDLKANIWKNPNNSEPDVNGWNFFDDNDDPRPRKFTPPYHLMEGNDIHGTPCAGVAAAVGDNAIGVTGIAYKCKILPVKIFLGDELVQLNTVADAIRYAGQKADVISASWSTPPSSNIEQAIKDVVRTGRGGKGTVVFVATGNGYQSSLDFPASVSESIAVGASNNLGWRSTYSNYGEGLDFVAPSSGGSIGIFTTDVSIKGRGFNIGDINQGDADGLFTNSFGGTSSATPLAAGVSGLILSLNPELKWDQVRKYMRDTADKIDLAKANYVNGYSLEYGWGRINAYEVLKKVKADMDGPVVPGNVIDKQTTPALPIPDDNLEGITSAIDIEEEGTIDLVEEISVNISHTYRGDLSVSLMTPGNEVIVFHEGEGGGADDLIESYNTGSIPTLQQLAGKGIRGRWLLRVADRAPQDTGTLNSWGLKLRVMNNIIRESDSPGVIIPDNDPKGITSILNVSEHGQIKDIKVNVDISHTYIGDLTVKLISPFNKTVTLHNRTGGTADNIQKEYNTASLPKLKDLSGKDVYGKWKLAVADKSGMDIGKLNKWGIEVRI
jgi:subtilisin-like proprotein convertase family protein